ncbi:MAG: calcium-translocating P-type ATPase, PMCA-type [Clostridiales bacterium]|nr:calcium-translocating P-type ATPase, PMCA-type [Clostridiales bacterium]
MPYHDITANETIDKLNTDAKKGLSEKESRNRLNKYGKNVIKDKKKKGFFKRFFAQFDDFMIIILLCAAGISFATSLLFGDGDMTEPVIILAIVILNAFLGAFQELRAEHSLAALKKLSSPTATVIRDGNEKKIASDLLVPGDIIRIRQGDIISADCRLIKCESLYVNEASLTGETSEIHKDADTVCDTLTAQAELKNMVMSSTSVTRGSALAVVTATGMDTEVGKIASMLINTTEEETPLQKRLANTGKSLGIACLFICGIIFIIGTFKHIPPLEMFMTSVSLAVAAIPEGLPAIVTILLALGVVRMSKHNAIVRHLPSVETLGCATVICTDKTGTLTLNEMKVSEVWSPNPQNTIRLSVLCSEDGEYINPTDKAILDCAASYSIDAKAYKSAHNKLAELPFDSLRKRMSVICDNKLIVKGALECILPICKKVETRSGTATLTKDEERKIIRENTSMTEKALRVIAVAYKNCSFKEDIYDETDLIFAGLIGIYDPPRPEAKSSVLTAQKAGVRTIMITGDHAMTASSIAKKTGILSENGRVICGTELESFTDEELCEAVKTCNVFARVTPEHKLKIVKALKRNGEICAMTGDGVNDAPALEGADIGCSMGISGTEVARSASDMVLTDDNFATIVYAIKEGRTIYDNIKKTVKFLLSTNIGEILTVMFGIIFGCNSPLTAIELLWVNLVTDSLPAVSLGLEKAEKDIMKRPPINPKHGIFSPSLWAEITVEGLLIGALSILAHSIGMYFSKNEVIARTMAFYVLAVSQLTHAFNMRTSRSVIKDGLFKNKYLVLSYLAGVILQLMLMYIPTLSDLFNISALSPVYLGISIVLSTLPLFFVELQKYINSHLINKG